eukprot:TRINITY_DN11435_c0_g1_i1.p1 TRINITY_DN11435_c0_g1~~TRINITY_DN11435_c0_g1_i1.p1  ORF type:complete len:562 (-),score=91.66 TRINITY_DN11435_c0_g1_i1:100-1785(-)
MHGATHPGEYGRSESCSDEQLSPSARYCEAPKLFTYQVIARPKSAPFQRASQPTASGRCRPLWRSSPSNFTPASSTGSGGLNTTSPTNLTSPQNLVFSGGFTMTSPTSQQNLGLKASESDTDTLGTQTLTSEASPGHKTLSAPKHDRSWIADYVTLAAELSPPSSPTTRAAKLDPGSPSPVCRAMLRSAGRVKKPFWVRERDVNAQLQQAEHLSMTAPVQEAILAETEKQRLDEEAKAWEEEECRRILNCFKRSSPEVSAVDTERQVPSSALWGIGEKVFAGSGTVSTPMTASKNLVRSSSAPHARAMGFYDADLRASSGSNDHGKLDGLVEVTVYFLETSDRFSLRVHPDLRIGPDKPPSRAADNWKPSYTESLKAMLEEISGVPMAHMALYCNKNRMGNDRNTLRSYNAHRGPDSQTPAEVQVRLINLQSVKHHAEKISHSCTKKWRQHQVARTQRKERFRNCSRADINKHSMPKWQTCVAPKVGTFFEYANRGIEGPLAEKFDLQTDGEAPPLRTQLFSDPFMRFGDYHTWRPDVGRPEWDAIRSGHTYTQRLQYEDA